MIVKGRDGAGGGLSRDEGRTTERERERRSDRDEVDLNWSSSDELHTDVLIKMHAWMALIASRAARQQRTMSSIAGVSRGLWGIERNPMILIKI